MQPAEGAYTDIMTILVKRRNLALGPTANVWDVTLPLNPFHLVTSAPHVLLREMMAEECLCWDDWSLPPLSDVAWWGRQKFMCL